MKVGWNLREGYHMENLIQKILGRMTPREQLLSEAELAHTAKKPPQDLQVD